MANGLQGLTKHLALCLSGGRSGKNRPRYSTTIHLYVCQQVNVEILVISYLRVTQGFVSFEGTFVFVIAAFHGSEIFFDCKKCHTHLVSFIKHHGLFVPCIDIIFRSNPRVPIFLITQILV
jgi:hypothetical protein